VRIVCGAGSIKRSGVRPSVSLSHQSNTAAACGGFAAECHMRKRYQSTAPDARQQQRRSPGRSVALSSKCGQCHVDSRINKAEHRQVTFYFRPIKILAVSTACVEFVSGRQHARNCTLGGLDLDGSTDKISRISLWKILQP